MRKKIQRSMVMVLAVTLLLSYIILTNRNLDTLEAEVRQEAKYIQAAINISGAEYLEEMDGVDWTTRVTQIDENGDVLYDTRRDSSTLENHSGRKEVREALAEGEGEDVRMSDKCIIMPFSWMTGRCCAPPSQWMVWSGPRLVICRSWQGLPLLC